MCPLMSEQSDPSRFRLAEIASFARQHALTILVGLLTLIVVYVTALPQGALMDPLQTRNITRWLLIGTFFILLVFGQHDKYRIFRVTNSALVPITVVLILLYIWLDAWGADELSREDRVVEDFSFLFPMLGAACLGIVAIMLLRRRELLTMFIAVLGAAVFFVIAMEEISWFQRVLEIESSELFLNLNDQGEMNFHNIYTHESEDIYYLGGFLLLVVLPYFREQLGDLLDRVGLTTARVLLPPFWLILPFVLAGAFVSQAFASRAANVTIVLGSLIILLGVIYQHFTRKEWGSVAHAVTTFVIILVAIVLLLGTDFVSQNVRPWIGKEYQELYIAWGIFAYGVSVVFQMLRIDQPADQSEAPS